MSLYNGDKGRDNRRRRARIKMRERNRELRKSLEPGAAKRPKEAAATRKS